MDLVIRSHIEGGGGSVQGIIDTGTEFQGKKIMLRRKTEDTKVKLDSLRILIGSKVLSEIPGLKINVTAKM